MLTQIQTTNGLARPSVYLTILVITLLLSAYVLWRRYISQRRLLARVAELEALSAAGRAIVESELDILALCQLIATEAGRVIDNDTFQIGRFEENLYEILYWQVNGLRQKTPQTFDLSQDSGVIGWVREHRQSLLVHDFQQEMANLPAKPRYISDSPPRSAIFIPMISGDNVLGIMAAQHPQPNRFTADDLRRLTILANQAAAAITNAQLYENAQARAAQLELVGRFARQLSQIQDIDAIFNEAVNLTHTTFGYNPVSILLVDSTTHEAVMQASNDPQLAQSRLRVPPGVGLIGTAVASQQMALSNDTTLDNRFVAAPDNPETHHVTNTLSEMAIPLQVDTEVLGVLDVQSSQRNAFSQSNYLTLQALATEVAIVIDKARRLNRQQEQAWLTTAQFQIAQAIGNHYELEAMVTAVTRLTAMLVGIRFCGLLVWEQDAGLYRWVGGFSEHLSTAATAVDFACKIGQWQPLDAVHVGQQALTTHKIALEIRPLLPPDSDTLTLLPVTLLQKPQGILLITPDKLPDKQRQQRRQELLENITTQLGQGIENARLRIAQQEEAWVNTVLLQVSEAVNSRIELNEILDTIVRLVPMLVGVASTLILIWDNEEEVFRVGPSHGINELGLGLLETLALDKPELERMATAHTSDTTLAFGSYYSVDLPEWLRKSLDTPVAFAFPLYARQTLVGVMIVGTQEPRLSPRRLNILNGIAHQAATAVVNNHLYHESAEKWRLEQELSVARDIQSNLIPPGSPQLPGCTVASLWQAARQVSGDFYDFLPLENGRWGIVVADVADKGFPAALFMALSRTILRTVAFNRSDPAKILMRANQIIDKDAQSDLFVTVFYAIWDPHHQLLHYANGGHNPPLLLHADGSYQLLNGEGMALGVLADIYVANCKIDIRPGDILIFYTDGVTEAINEDYDEFGLDRMRMAAYSAHDQKADGIVAAIRRALSQHTGDTPQFDDITLVVMKRNVV